MKYIQVYDWNTLTMEIVIINVKGVVATTWIDKTFQRSLKVYYILLVFFALNVQQYLPTVN